MGQVRNMGGLGDLLTVAVQLMVLREGRAAVVELLEPLLGVREPRGDPAQALRAAGVSR